MKRISGILAAIGLTLALASCSSKKDISYFQDLKPGMETVITKETPIRLERGDKISILVVTSDSRLNAQFNLPVSHNRIGQDAKGDGVSSSSSGGSGELAPYQIDKDGDIRFPVLGKLHIAGMTREEVAEYIRRELISRDLAKDPIVTVDYMNLAVTVLGEVGSPGRQAIGRDNYTLLDALSAAGDLTIYGKRNNVKVIREENGIQKVYTVDLTNGKSVTQSPVYYLRQNDLVYVEPNSTKAMTSTPNGNLWSQPTFWMSTASFLMTIVLMFVK